MNRGSIIHVPRRFVADEWGGTETVILEISKQQLAAGYQPKIITSMALADSSHAQIGGIPVERHRHLYPFFGLGPTERQAMDKKGGNLLSFPLFAALLRERKVRLFHAHALKRLGGTVRTVARLQRKPYVVSLHGGIFDVPAAELDDLTKPIRGKFEWGRPFGALLGARRVLQDANHVICVGESEAHRARAELSHDRVSYLPNGVDSQRFRTGEPTAFRSRFHIPQDSFLIVNVGRIDSQKNQLCLLEAFARFRQKTPEARLLLVGPVTQKTYEERLNELIESENLGEAVRIIPGFDNESGLLVDCYHAADVFVLASRHEPFGIVILEAWCAGRPVVASRVGGLQSLIHEGETGLFFDPSAEDAPAQLARCLARLHADPGLRQRLGEAGKQEALAHYEWSRIADRLEGIYQRAEEDASRRKESR